MTVSSRTASAVAGAVGGAGLVFTQLPTVWAIRSDQPRLVRRADDGWRRDLVRRYGITHVLLTPLERVPGGFDPRSCPWLAERAVFGEGEARAALYAVIESARSPLAAGTGIPPASRSPRP